jgi:DNA-binding transcriptional LysR family regulator
MFFKYPISNTNASMKILYMKYFFDAARLGSVSAAAKANFVTQSAVSQGINKLEEMMGCLLTAHHPNRFRLTPEGKRSFSKIADLLKKIDELQKEFSKEYQDVGDLEFASNHSFALAFIPSLLNHFRKEYPKVKINFHLSSKLHEIKEMLRTGQIDFGIAPQVGDFSGFEKQIIYQGSYGLYVSSKISPREEKKLKFILPSLEDTTFLKETYLQKFSKPLDVFLEVGSWEVLANLSIEGLGIGYFPDYVARKKEALRPIKINLKLPSYDVCAFYPKGMRLRKSSQLFLSCLQKMQKK